MRPTRTMCAFVGTIAVAALSVQAQQATETLAAFTERIRAEQTFLPEHFTFVAIPARPAPPREEGLGRSGSTLRIYPESQVFLGSGYSTLAGTPRNHAVLLTAAARGEQLPLSQSTQDLEIDYDFKLIESYEDLARTLSIDASASYKGISGGASARFNLYRSARMTSRSVYVLVRMSMLSRVEQLSSMRLRDEALRILRSSGPGAFFTTYGDTFVYRVGYGAELFALLEFQVREGESKETISAAVDAQLGAFSANVSFSSSVNELTRTRNVKVQYAQTGGGTGRQLDPTAFPAREPSVGGVIPSSGGVLTITPSELEYRIRDFPREVREHPDTAKVIWADVLDYYAVSNRPLKLGLYDLTSPRWVLEDLAVLHRDLIQVRHTWWDFISVAGTTTVAPNPTLEDLFCLDDTLQRLQRTGEVLVSTPGVVQAVVDGIGANLLPSPHNLRRYVLELQQIGVPPASTTEPNVCGRFTNLTEFIEFLVTRQIPVRSAAPPSRERMQAGTISVGPRGAGRHRFSVTFATTFQNDPVVMLTVAGNTASDADKFVISTSAVSRTGFTADICRIPNPEDGRFAPRCISWGNGSVAIQWLAVPGTP